MADLPDPKFRPAGERARKLAEQLRIAREEERRNPVVPKPPRPVLRRLLEPEEEEKQQNLTDKQKEEVLRIKHAQIKERNLERERQSGLLSHEYKKQEAEALVKAIQHRQKQMDDENSCIAMGKPHRFYGSTRYAPPRHS
jgi:hypothetical protein